MPAAKSPFVERVARCPICGESVVNREIRARLYVEEEREPDHHVKRYRWGDPDFAGIHPPYYYLWHCPYCYYTDVREDFENAYTAFSNLAKKATPVLTQARTTDGPVARLGRAVDYTSMGFETAMNAHLLAIHIQELLPEAERDVQKLARLYLRAAWLHRERKPTEVRSVVQEALGDVQLQMDALERVLKDVDGCLGRLAVALKRCRAIHEEQGLDTFDASRFAGVMETLSHEARAFREGLQGFRKEIGEVELADAGGRSSGYQGFASYQEFLAWVAGGWLGMPLNERDCLKGAVAYYERLYEKEGGALGDGAGINHLIIDLHRRLGNYDRALDYAIQIVRDGFEERQAITRMIRETKDLSATERATLTGKVTALTALIEGANELKKELEQLRFNDYYPRAKRLLQGARAEVADELEIHLRQSGIPEAVVEELRRRGELRAGAAGKAAVSRQPSAVG
jgi:tetratricopeptide (TPR) repeat protein